MKAFLRSFWVATILSCLSDVATAAPISAVFRFEADRDLVASSPFPGNINTARELAPPGTSPNVTFNIRTRSPEARLEAEAQLLINGSLSSDRQILGRNPITLNLGGADLAYSYSTSIGAGVTVGINPDRFTVDLSNFIPANVGIPRSIGGDISNQNIIDQSFSLDSESGQGTAFGQSLRVQGRYMQAPLGCLGGKTLSYSGRETRVKHLPSVRLSSPVSSLSRSTKSIPSKALPKV